MSDRLKGLRETLADVTDRMESIVAVASGENRDFSKEETADFDAQSAKADKIKGDIGRETTLVDLRSQSARTPVAAAATVPAGSAARVMMRHGALKAFRGEGAEEKAYRSGKWLCAALLGHDDAREYCRDNGIAIRSAASEGSNPSGGFLVPEEYNQAVIDLRESYGTFRSHARVIPMARDTMSIPRRASGLTTYYVGENSTITASDKTWNNVNLTARKLASLSLYSTELAEDAVISIADDLANEMAYQFAVSEDSAGWNGDGTSTYGGIQGVRPKIIDGNHAAGAVDAASGVDTFAEVTATDLANVMAVVPQYALGNAKWYCSQPAASLVFGRLTAAAGGNTIETLSGPARYSYLGYPIVIDQTLPTSTGDLSNVAMLFFGDLSLACTMGERRGFSVKTSDQRYIELDQLAIVATERFDINVHDLGDGTTAGPIAALVGE